MESWNHSEVLEWVGTLLSLGYVILLMFNKVWAWPCGIFGSAIMAYTFVNSAQVLYMEAVSYSVYTVLGIYGLWHWLQGRNNPQKSRPIVKWSAQRHFWLVAVGVLISLSLAYGLRNTQEARPLVDSFTTVFAMIGTWMQARKVLSNWWYWLVINGVSIGLYSSTEFNQYAMLSVVFTILSVTGYLGWKKIYDSQEV